MRPVPIADWAIEARMPIEGPEQHGAVVIVGEDVNDRVNHAAKDKRQPPMSTRVGFPQKAPKQDGVDDKGGG